VKIEVETGSRSEVGWGKVLSQPTPTFSFSVVYSLALSHSLTKLARTHTRTEPCD
jgi:hypothetical protein